MKTRSASKTRHGVVLPHNACGEEITVPDATHSSCPKCREIVLRFEDARRLRQRALEIYRAEYGLLTADEIRSIRERHGLAQAEMARRLRLGGNTISRWEAGQNVQTASMDMLLRMIRESKSPWFVDRSAQNV